MTEQILRAAALPNRITGALGPAGHPVADLRRLAKRLGSATAASDFSDIAGMPGPQLLQELGTRFGLALALVTRSVDQLGPGDCPCVLLLKDGSSRLVTEASEEGYLRLAGDGEATLAVSRQALADQASGAIFSARRIDPGLRDVLPEARDKSAALRASVLGAVPNAGQPGGNPFFQHLMMVAAERKGLIAALALAGLLSGLINLAVPIFTMVVFDRVIPHGAFETLWALLIGVGVLLLVDLALRHVRHALGDAVSLAASTGFGAKLFSRLLHAPMAAMPRQAGSLMQPYQELNQAATIGPQFIAGLMVDLPFFLIVLGFLWSLGGWLAAIPALGALLLLGIHWVGYRMQIQDLGDEARLSQRQTQMMVDAVSAAELTRISGAGPEQLMRWEERADAAAVAGHKLRSRQNFANHAGAVVMQLVTVATIAAGAYAVTASLMTVGALSACMMLASRAIMPVAQLMGQGFRLQQIALTSAVLARFAASDAEAPGDSSESAAARPVYGAYQFTNVGFAHGAGGQNIISGLSISFQAGERIGIIGKTGSGKSTLLKLMVRLHEPTGGNIHIDGRDIRQLDPLTLRRAVAMMPQEAVLFDATLDSNLKVGLGNVDESWFQKVTELTGVADFANRSPSGFSLETGPGGQRLSGGERQSVLLARALMGRPKRVLLDEPTSAMDNEREARIVKALAAELKDGALKETGLIVATHRLPMLQLVDRLIWMDGGRIVADGPKDEIFRKFGLAA